MTSYPGPWIQAPDYEAVGEWSDAAPELPIANVAYQHDWSTGPDAEATKESMLHDILTALKTDLNARSPSMTEAEAAAFIESFGFVSDGARYLYRFGVSTTHEDGIDSGGPYGAFSVEHNVVAEASFRPQAVSPFHHSVNAWAPSILFPPPGAIGWEWSDGTPSDQAKPSDVLGAVGRIYPTKDGFKWTDGSTAPTVATLGTQLLPCPAVTYTSDAGWAPDSAFADNVVDWLGPFTIGGATTEDQAIDLPNADPTFQGWTTPVAGDFDGVDYSLPHSEAGTPEHHDPVTIDLAPYLDRLGRATFTTRVYTAAEVEIPGQTAYGYQPRGLDVIWTFRPPVFRWLYATPQITSAPPLRHTQRDDNHGPSPRNRPARSRQAGHRNTGYL